MSFLGREAHGTIWMCHSLPFHKSDILGRPVLQHARTAMAAAHAYRSLVAGEEPLQPVVSRLDQAYQQSEDHAELRGGMGARDGGRRLWSDAHEQVRHNTVLCVYFYLYSSRDFYL